MQRAEMVARIAAAEQLPPWLVEDFVRTLERLVEPLRVCMQKLLDGLRQLQLGLARVAEIVVDRGGVAKVVPREKKAPASRIRPHGVWSGWSSWRRRAWGVVPRQM